MAYIGNTPAEAYISISSQTFTTINGTDYVLSSSVTNSEDIALFLNNVRQKPSTYTATGTTLTMGTATTTADELYCVYLGKGIQTVTPGAASVGTAQIADDAVTTAKILDDAVTTAKILDDNVTTDKILDANVTTAKTDLVSTGSVGAITAKGTSGVTDGYITLNCDQNSHGVKIKSPAHSAAQSYTLTLPATAPLVNKFIETDGSGNLSFSSVDVTTDITGTVPTANLGSGTASASTFLRGDQTYAAAGGGAWTVKTSGTLDGTPTTLEITGITKSIRIWLTDFSCSGACVMRVSDDNGTTWKSGASDYKYCGVRIHSHVGSVNAQYSNGADSFATNFGVGTSVYRSEAEFVVGGPETATTLTTLRVNYADVQASGNCEWAGVSGAYQTAATIDAVQLSGGDMYGNYTVLELA